MRLSAISSTAVVLALSVCGPATAGWLENSLSEPTPENELLDIGVQPFDPGLDRKWAFARAQERVQPEVRQAEATFLAVHLMRTLQSTERFGLVRMVPANSLTADLMVSGKIRYSTGRRLEIEIRVVDATGRHWFKKRYKASAEAMSYAIRFQGTSEPFQRLYDEIAFDLIEEQEQFRKEYLSELRDVAELRYAAQLVPGVFGGYLTVGRKDRVQLERLPSRDDPMIARIRQIQAHNEFFLDLLTERFQSFYDDMDETYDEYRANSHDVETELVQAIRLYNVNARPHHMGDRGDFGSHARWEAQRAAYYRRRAAAQARYLDDIALNFSSVVEPMVIELDGETLRLEGSIEDQYDQWQEMLETIFENETGIPATPKPAQTASTTTPRP